MSHTNIFDCRDGPSPAQTKVIAYNFEPSVHLHSVRNILLQRRKRKQSTATTSTLSNRPFKKTRCKDDLGDGGLPSPPMESSNTDFELPKSNGPDMDHGAPVLVSDKPLPLPAESRNDQDTMTTTESQPTPMESMSTEEIVKKLEELKQEKHRLFQLMKRLVQEEAEQEQRMEQEKKEAERKAAQANPSAQPTWPSENSNLLSPPDEAPSFRQPPPPQATAFYPPPPPFFRNDRRFRQCPPSQKKPFRPPFNPAMGRFNRPYPPQQHPMFRMPGPNPANQMPRFHYQQTSRPNYLPPWATPPSHHGLPRRSVFPQP